MKSEPEIAVAGARELHKSDRAFGSWWDAQGFELNEDDRAALCAMGKDPERLREVLGVTSRTSIRLIYIEEFRFRSSAKPENSEPRKVERPKKLQAENAKAPRHYIRGRGARLSAWLEIARRRAFGKSVLCRLKKCFRKFERAKNVINFIDRQLVKPRPKLSLVRNIRHTFPADDLPRVFLGSGDAGCIGDPFVLEALIQPLNNLSRQRAPVERRAGLEIGPQILGQAQLEMSIFSGHWTFSPKGGLDTRGSFGPYTPRIGE